MKLSKKMLEGIKHAVEAWDIVGDLTTEEEKTSAQIKLWLEGEFEVRDPKSKKKAQAKPKAKEKTPSLRTAKFPE